jgi:hypothetical protein
MKSSDRNLLALSVFSCSLAFASTAVAEDLSLEPCMNGGVSSTGLYASQAGEDRAKAAYAEAYELEPCMNGGVSASGRYASQVEEDASEGFLAESGAMGGEADLIPAFNDNRDEFLR